MFHSILKLSTPTKAHEIMKSVTVATIATARMVAGTNVTWFPFGGAGELKDEVKDDNGPIKGWVGTLVTATKVHEVPTGQLADGVRCISLLHSALCLESETLEFSVCFLCINSIKEGVR